MFTRIQGPARENQGRRVDSWETEGFFSKKATRRGIGSAQPSDLKSMTEIRSEHERMRADARRAALGAGGLRR
jgi:hypothetical protein